MATYRGQAYGRYWVLKQRENPWAMDHAPGEAFSDLSEAQAAADLVTLATAAEIGKRPHLRPFMDYDRECVYDFAKREIIYRGQFTDDQLAAYIQEQSDIAAWHEAYLSGHAS